MPKGKVDIYADLTTIKIKATSGMGMLKFKSKVKPIVSFSKLKELGEGNYEMVIEPNVEYTISNDINGE